MGKELVGKIGKSMGIRRVRGKKIKWGVCKRGGQAEETKEIREMF